MDENERREPTRRQVLSAAALGALLITPSDGMSNEPQADSGTSAYEKNLAKPLDALGKEKLAAAIAYAETIHKQRMDFKLPENSEPCTIYVPQRAKAE